MPRLWAEPNLLTLQFVPRGMAASAASAALSVAGVALAIWARNVLGRNWSVEVAFKQDHALITGGPYAVIRHPIYTAVILLVLGLALLVGTLGAAAGLCLVIAGCWIKLRQEEALMAIQFPQDYPAYMIRTARLVPFLV